MSWIIHRIIMFSEIHFLLFSFQGCLVKLTKVLRCSAHSRPVPFGATFITGIFRILKKTFMNIFSFIMSFYMMLFVDRDILWRAVKFTSAASTSRAITTSTTMIMIICSSIIFKKCSICFWKCCWTSRTRLIIFYRKFIILLCHKKRWN